MPLYGRPRPCSSGSHLAGTRPHPTTRATIKGHKCYSQPLIVHPRPYGSSGPLPCFLASVDASWATLQSMNQTPTRIGYGRGLPPPWIVRRFYRPLRLKIIVRAGLVPALDSGTRPVECSRKRVDVESILLSTSAFPLNSLRSVGLHSRGFQPTEYAIQL